MASDTNWWHRFSKRCVPKAQAVHEQRTSETDCGGSHLRLPCPGSRAWATPPSYLQDTLMNKPESQPRVVICQIEKRIVCHQRAPSSASLQGVKLGMCSTEAPNRCVKVEAGEDRAEGLLGSEPNRPTANGLHP